MTGRLPIPKMALGGDPHFLGVINGMSCVCVSAKSTVRVCFARCVVPAAAFHPHDGGRGGEEAEET